MAEEQGIREAVEMTLDGVADKYERMLARQYIKSLEEKLTIALGADKPEKPATPTERARYWALEAATQKERADKAEMILATFPMVPITHLLEDAYGDDAEAIEVWISRVKSTRI